MDEQFIKCIDEWSSYGVDDRIEQALDVYDQWSKNLNHSQKNQLAKMLKNFHYYTSKRVDDILKDLHRKAVETYGISNQDTVVSVVRKKNGMLGSSSDYWLRYQLASGMSRRIFYDSLDDISLGEWNNIFKVVFIDDCSGSGETFIKFLDRQRKNFKGKQIVLITIEMMKEAENCITNYAITKGLLIGCICNNIQDKALSIFNETEVAEFIQLSQTRKIEEKDIKGYKETESLMAFYNNTPNNTLGIFRCKTQKNTPLFPRKFEEEAGWKRCNSDKIRRTKQRYNAKVVGGNNEL